MNSTNVLRSMLFKNGRIMRVALFRVNLLIIRMLSRRFILSTLFISIGLNNLELCFFFNFILSSRFLFPFTSTEKSRYSNIWQRRTTLEKVLLSFYIILGTIALTSLVIYFVVFNQSAGKRQITQTTSHRI